MNSKLANHRVIALRSFWTAIPLFLIMAVKAPANAAPVLNVSSATVQAGNSATLSVNFNPSPNSVAGLQFNLTLPAGVSTGAVVGGAMLAPTAANKMVNANLSGNVFTIIVFGFNQNAIPSGQLLTLDLSIAGSVGAGTLNIPISGIVYTDANGSPITGGTSTGGSITVTAVTPSAPSITSANTATGTAGSAFSYQITATNSPTSFNATGLPSGLSINTTTGLISGTPSAAGTSTVNLSATNAGGTGTRTLTLTINAATPAAPSITSANTATGTVGTAFTYQITATNSPTSYNATGLPAGLSINTTSGQISGTPTAAGTSSVSLSATNAGGTGTRTLTLTVTAPTSTTPTLSVGSASGNTGSSVNLPVTFNAGSAAVTGLQFNLTLPAGLSTGTITPGAIIGVSAANKQVSNNLSGNTWTIMIFGVNQNVIASGTLLTLQVPILTSATAGAKNITISGIVFTDANGQPIVGGTSTGGTVTVTVVTPSAPVISSPNTASGTVGSPFSYQIAASNSPTSFAATGLPAGLSISTTTGLISGTPTAAGTSTVNLSATNAGGTGTRTLTLTISAATPSAPSITSAGTATGTVGTAFSYQITATNSPTSFSATGLPGGLSVNTSNGAISGMPTTAGTASVMIGATNAGGTGTRTLTLTINPAVATAPVILGGSVSGTAGSTVDLPVSFNPGGRSVVSLQFSFTIPAGLTAGTVTPSLFLNGLSKQVSSNVSGNTWTFIIFGLNQTPITSGPLFTAQMTIAGGTSAGTLTLPVSNATYADANGQSVTPGNSTPGTVTILSGGNGGPLPSPDLSTTPELIPLNGTITAAYPSGYPTVNFVWTFTPDSGNLSATNSFNRTISRAVQIGVPTRTQSNSIGLAGSDLPLGRYTMSVYAILGNQVSPTVSKTVTLIPGDFATMRVFPNPWRSDRHSSTPFVTFDNLPPASSIKIFTVSGHHVADPTVNGNSAQWDLKNSSGDKAASGIYLYVVTDAAGQKAKGKIVIIK
jgi:hypothetical protein